MADQIPQKDSAAAAVAEERERTEIAAAAAEAAEIGYSKTPRPKAFQTPASMKELRTPA